MVINKQLELKKMNNILIVIPTNKLGGAEQILKMIANCYENNVHVFFLQKKTNSAWDDSGQILHYSFFNNKFLSILSLFVFCVRKGGINKWDRIYTSHVNVTGIIGFFLKLGILQKGKFIARESTTIFKRYKGVKLKIYTFMYILGYSQVDLLICQTDDMKRQLIEVFPRLKKKAKVIPNPIDAKLIDANLNENILEKRNGKYIVSAGRLIPEKGYDILISAFYELKKQALIENVKLIILGEGIERDNLERLVKSLRLQEDVIFEGFVENVYPYFKNALLCVVASRIEGFPNVLLQMMSQNDKIVSTKCAGGIDGIEGVFVCDTHSENALIETIKKALITDTRYCRDLFNQALRERSIENFISKAEFYVNEE